MSCTYTHTKPLPKFFWPVAVLLLLAGYPLHAQQVNWDVRAPIPNAVSAGSELFISVAINEQYSFSTTGPVTIFLDNQLISGNLKINGNKLHLLYPGIVSSGRHKISLEAYIDQLKKTDKIEWEFFLSAKGGETLNLADTVIQRPPAVGVSGVLVMDNRNEFLSGPGQELRQEPPSTRTINLDAIVSYKNALMPLKFFATSNNANALQSMNYMQAGFINKWLEVEVGDLNPNIDQLILTGVRVRGIKAMFKYKASSVQLFYGRMNKAFEGSIQNYIPGNGIVPANLINDTQYIDPGIFRRMMMAARIESGNRREIFKIGLNMLRVTDDTGSIKFGIAPKQNIAAGLDLTLKLLKKALIIQSGVAGSILTNDISNGVIDERVLDTFFHIKLGFDPKKYEKIIILNSSTVPTILTNPDYLSWFGRANYTNKYQSFSFEYRKNGPLFYSLGNPFLRNNYEGVSIGDRFSFYKKRFTVNLNYQNYSNDLNNTLPTKVYTNAYKASIFMYLRSQWPTVLLNYLQQDRKGVSDFLTIPGISDVMKNYLVNIGYTRSMLGISHHFSLMFNAMDRIDRFRIENRITSYNTMFGVTETFSERYSVQASFGKAIIKGVTGRISNINIYDLSFDWQIKPQKYFTTISLSNVNTLATLLSNESYRMSAVAKFGYRFWRGMLLEAEGGYQPFRDITIDVNNYNESYIYLRYTTDLGSLFTR